MQGFIFINFDRDMREPKSREWARCRNSNLNEDLGKVWPRTSRERSDASAWRLACPVDACSVSIPLLCLACSALPSSAQAPLPTRPPPSRAPPQVEYIFSDKTGTLTSNEMQLRQIAVKGVAYGSTEVCNHLQVACFH